MTNVRIVKKFVQYMERKKDGEPDKTTIRE